MVNVPQLALRSWTFLWTLITLALIGNAVSLAFAGNPSSINYAMFTAVFCMLVVLWGFAAVFVEALAMPLFLGVADALATFFSLIAGIVLAAKLGVHSCGNQAYVASNSLTDGAYNRGHRCHELQAACAFFWFMFAGFAASTAFSFIGSGSGLSARRGGGIRKGPSMSQV